MDSQWSEIAANGVIHEASKAFAEWQSAAWQQVLPSVLYRPKISLDGNCYCALYGENLMEGCAGFGETMAEAMADFDKNWSSQKAPTLSTKTPCGGSAEQFARVAECAFDDRPRSRVGHPSHMDWEEGYREGTQAAASAIRATTPLTVEAGK